MATLKVCSNKKMIEQNSCFCGSRQPLAKLTKNTKLSPENKPVPQHTSSSTRGGTNMRDERQASPALICCEEKKGKPQVVQMHAQSLQVQQSQLLSREASKNQKDQQQRHEQQQQRWQARTKKSLLEQQRQRGECDKFLSKKTTTTNIRLSKKISTSPQPRSSGSLTSASALVYQIVIISLILHELPSSSFPHFYHRSSSASTKSTNILRQVEASLVVHSSSQDNDRQQQQQRQERQHFHHQRDHYQTSLMENTRSDEQPPINGGGDHDEPHHADGARLKRRHLAAASEHYLASLRKRAAATAGNGKAQHDAECQKLAAMWLYLHSSYPTLASRLLEWAASQAGGKQTSDEQFLWARSPQAARSIGQLLDEAERLISASGQRKEAAEAATTASETHQHNRNLAGAAWLARVSSNPAYAKLVQHLRKQQARLSAHHKLSPAAPSSSSGADAAAVTGQEAGKTTGNGDSAMDADSQMAAAASATPSLASSAQAQIASQQQQQTMTTADTYGRVVHYPHEIGNTDNSHGMTRTLDKLRFLNHHNRQQQEQLEQLEQQQQSGAADRDIEETNRIPLASGGDVDQMTESDWHKMGESATDAARHNFVYGKVLIRPASQHHDQSEQQTQRDEHPAGSLHHRHHQRPLATLRELAQQQERQRMRALDKQQPSPSIGADKQQNEQQATASPDTFGRVLSGPLATSTPTLGDNDKSAQKQSAQTQLLDDLRAAANSASNTMAAAYGFSGANDGSLDGGASDELVSQQRFQQMAMDETGNAPSQTVGQAQMAGSRDTSDEEFPPGEYTAPFKETEIRLLRSLDEHQQQEQRAKDNKQQQQAELVVMKSNDNSFVVN